MKSRSVEAARLETDYLARVKTAIAGREASEVDEIIQSLREHIEEELSEKPDKQISLVQMANVLEQLGPPENYAQEEGAAATTTIASDLKAEEEKPRLSKLAVASVLCIPTAMLLPALLYYIGGQATALAAAISCYVVMPVLGVVLGIAALAAIHNAPKKLYGRMGAWIGIFVLPVLVLFTLAFMSTTYSERPAVRIEMGGK